MSRFRPGAAAPPSPPEEAPEIDEPEAPDRPPDPGIPYPVPDPGVPYPVPDPGSPPDPDPRRGSPGRGRKDAAGAPGGSPRGARLPLAQAGNCTAVSEFGRGVPRWRQVGGGPTAAGAPPLGAAAPGEAGAGRRLVAVPPLTSLEGGCVLLVVPEAHRRPPLGRPHRVG